MDNKIQKDFDRFKNLGYEDFKQLAKDESLSKYQKIGFPDSYREGKEHIIFQDIMAKLDIEPAASGKVILDIGPGCSDLPNMIVEYCAVNHHDLLLCDSKEMLDLLPSGANIKKLEGYFPDETADLINNFQGGVDYIICYSIFHYVFYNTSGFKFIDAALSLLKPGGKMLIADIPNISKRRRFFSSDTGIAFHKKFTNTDTLPEVNHLQFEPAQIDDGVVFGIMQRYRNFGFETYLLPQNKELAMANRREDILIAKI